LQASSESEPTREDRGPVLHLGPALTTPKKKRKVPDEQSEKPSGPPSPSGVRTKKKKKKKKKKNTISQGHGAEYGIARENNTEVPYFG